MSKLAAWRRLTAVGLAQVALLIAVPSEAGATAVGSIALYPNDASNCSITANPPYRLPPDVGALEGRVWASGKVACRTLAGSAPLQVEIDVCLERFLGLGFETVRCSESVEYVSGPVPMEWSYSKTVVSACPINFIGPWRTVAVARVTRNGVTEGVDSTSPPTVLACDIHPL